MQVESRVASSYSEDSGINESDFSHIKSQRRYTNPSQIKARDLTTSAKTDKVSASVVIGFTAQFVAFIFGLVTSFIPSLIENLLLSLFMGLCVGVIAFALMKEED